MTGGSHWGPPSSRGNFFGLLLYKFRVYCSLKRLSCPPPPSLASTVPDAARGVSGPPGFSVGCFNCTHAQLIEARFAQDARNSLGMTAHSEKGGKRIDFETLGLYLPAHMDLIPKAITQGNASRLYLVADRAAYTTAVLKVTSTCSSSTEIQGYRLLNKARVPAARLIWHGRKFSDKLTLLVMETLTCTLGSVLMAAAQEIDAGNCKLLRDVLGALRALLQSLGEARLVCADLGTGNIMCRELRKEERYREDDAWGDSDEEDAPIKLQLVLVDPCLVAPMDALQSRGCHPEWLHRWNALHLAASIQSLTTGHRMDPRVMDLVLPALLPNALGATSYPKQDMCRFLEGLHAGHLPAVAQLVRDALLQPAPVSPVSGFLILDSCNW